MQSNLTRADFEDFLVYLTFGAPSDFLQGAITTAYRDFSRTLHGIARLEAKDLLREQATSELGKVLMELRERQVNQDTFDGWHRNSCGRLVDLYREYGHHFYIGQAQKWINMTLKYVFVLGEERVTGFRDVYPYCHVPLDNLLLEKLAKYGFPPLDCAWSRLDDYEEYLKRQEWIRNKFEAVPLDVEFRLWLDR